MNPLTNMKNQQKLNEKELNLGLTGTGSSWHRQYEDSAWVFAGGLPYELTEGDVICVFSQYGEIMNINLIRDKDTGKSKGFAFICYEDQRSTILAVDNLNGAKVLGRALRVDHKHNYQIPKEHGNEDDLTKKLKEQGCAPSVVSTVEDEEKRKKKKEKKSKKKKRRTASNSPSHQPKISRSPKPEDSDRKRDSSPSGLETNHASKQDIMRQRRDDRWCSTTTEEVYIKQEHDDDGYFDNSTDTRRQHTDRHRNRDRDHNNRTENSHSSRQRDCYDHDGRATRFLKQDNRYSHRKHKEERGETFDKHVSGDQSYDHRLSVRRRKSESSDDDDYKKRKRTATKDSVSRQETDHTDSCSDSQRSRYRDKSNRNDDRYRDYKHR